MFRYHVSSILFLIFCLGIKSFVFGIFFIFFIIWGIIYDVVDDVICIIYIFMFGFIPQTVQFVSLWSPCERFRWLKASPRKTDYHPRGFVDFFLFSHHLFEAHKPFMLVICHLFKILWKEGIKLLHTTTHHQPFGRVCLSIQHS